jgi:hypothetical protein
MRQIDCPGSNVGEMAWLEICGAETSGGEIIYYWSKLHNVGELSKCNLVTT